MDDRSSQYRDNEELLLRMAWHADEMSTAGGVLVPLAALILLRWLNEQDREAEAVALFEGRDYRRLLPPTLRWESLRDYLASADPGSILPEAILGEVGMISERENDAPYELGAVARRIQFCIREQLESQSLHPGVLSSAFTWLDQYVGEDGSGDRTRIALSAAFEALLKRTISSDKGANLYQTPHAVADFIVELAKPLSHERVYDPCFGIGELLTIAAGRLANSTTSGTRERPPIYGGEVSPSMFLIGAARVALADAMPRLEIGDSLERDFARNGIDEGFDCVVAVPPFGGKVDVDHYSHFPVPSRDATELFVQHSVAALRTGGRAVVAVPEGFRWRGGTARAVRRWLLNEFRLEAVVALPKDAFLPYTSIRTSLLLIRREEPCREVWFYGGEQLDAVLSGPSSTRIGALSERRKRADLIHSIFNAPDRTSPDQRYEPDEFAIPISVAELKARDYELDARRQGEAELDAFLDRARERTRQLQVSALGQILQVQRGMNYRRSQTTEDANTGLVPLIRVGDLNDGVIHSADLLYSGDNLPEERYLASAGDVLLSISGTIAKAAVVPESLAGAVVTSGLVMLRSKEAQHEKIQPEYLSALLKSAVYQDWLVGHARGGYRQHLRLSVLRRLPVPVPTPEQQARLIQQSREGADLAEALLSVGEDKTLDPLKSWLLSTSSASTASSQGWAREPVSRWSAWKSAARLRDSLPLGRPSISSALSQLWRSRDMPHPEAEEHGLTAWVDGFVQLGHQLDEALEIEPGPDRYALLEGLRQPVRSLLKRIPEAEAAVRERADNLTRQLIERVEKEREDLLSAIRLTGRVEPSFLDLGDSRPLTVIVRNDGPLRLRELFLGTALGGETLWDAKNVASGEEVSVEIQVAAHTAGERYFYISWEARRFDGGEASGEIELAYHVRGVRDSVSADVDDLGNNPYTAGVAIAPEDSHLFKGREDTLSEIKAALDGQGGSATIIVEGARRIGKSSLVKRLVEDVRSDPNWVPVYYDYQQAPGSDEREGLDTYVVFSSIAAALTAGAHQAGVGFDVPGYGRLNPGTLSLMDQLRLDESLLDTFRQSSNPAGLLDRYVSEVLQAVVPARMLLVLDEFDKIQQGIESGATSTQVPENIRALFQKHTALAGLFVGSMRLRRLREEYFNALYGFGRVIPIGPLDRDAARRLVTEPVAGRLVYAPAAVKQIVDLTQCEPFLIQGLCQLVFDICRRSEERTVTVALVESAADTFVQTSNHFAHVFHVDAGSDRKRYIIAVTEAQESKGARPTYVSYEQMLGESGVSLANLDRDLEDLVQEGILDRKKRGGEDLYRLRVPLFASWVRLQDYTILKHHAVRRSS